VSSAALFDVSTFDPAAATAAAMARMRAVDFAAHRGAMLRFARRRIRDEDLAEDAVQDALLAALSSRDSFQGRSAPRTWLIGILNHKIQDVFRRESRYVRQSVGETIDEDRDEGGAPRIGTAVDTLADSDPAREVSRRRMHDALVIEIEALPEKLRDVFRLQVVEGLPTAEVCQRLGISEANCWVRLHRARKRLSGRMSASLE
jgi:RNA polymerase sigma-70 factor (ECF subfamily)